MSPRLLRPRASGLIATDADARAYISAVQIADGSSLEPAVQRAIDDFVKGCKSDSIWSAIKASCILMGARTLSGALTPLVGSAPTNNGPFVSGDYNRKTGLLGDGVGKYLNSNRNNNADPQNSNHNAVYQTEGPVVTANGKVYIGTDGIGSAGANNLFVFANTGVVAGFSRALANQTVSGSGNQSQGTHLVGHSRSSSSQASLRVAGSNYTASNTSTTPQNANVLVYARTPASPALFSDARLAFYSIGESLDLALLDTRLTNLYNAIGAAI